MRQNNKSPTDVRFKTEIKYLTYVTKIDIDTAEVIKDTTNYYLIKTETEKHRYKTKIITYVTKAYRHNGQQKLKF